MGKIIGKSALCFVGLAVASWLVQLLSNYLLLLYPKPLFLSLVWMFLLEFTLWLLLPLAYSYLLFRIFKNKKYCCLIMMFHGIFIIVQYYVLLMLHIGGNVIIASLRASMVAGAPLMLLALMLHWLRTHRSEMRPAKSTGRKVLGALAKSALCFLALVAATYAFSLLCSVPITVFGYVGLFIQSPFCVFPVIIIAYAYLLFRLTERGPQRFWVMGANAVALMVLSAVELFIPGLTIPFPAFLTAYFPPHAVALFGNIALLLPILVLIFRSMEQYDASALDASALHPTPATGGETNLPAQ